MVQSCCCYGCNERFVKGGPVSFHCFPKDVQRTKLWLQKINRKDFVPTQHSKVCSKHFTEECFDRERFGNTWLKSDAVPTIFDFPQQQLPKVYSRKSQTKVNVSNAKEKQAPAAQRQEATKLVEPDLPPTIATPGRKCFVCSKEAGSTGSPLTALTNITKIQLHQKLSKVIGAELDLVVDEDGMICNGCCRQLNHLDRIEVEHRLLTKSIVDCMRRTSGLSSVRDDSRMPEVVLASIEDHSKNSRIPVEKYNISLDVPAQETSDGAASQTKTVAASASDEDVKKINKTLLVDRTTEKKKSQRFLVDRVTEKKKNQPILVARVNEKKTDAEQDKPNYHCKVCNFESKYKSVFLFHLQRHLQCGYRCDLCNVLLPKDLCYWIARMHK